MTPFQSTYVTRQFWQASCDRHHPNLCGIVPVYDDRDAKDGWT